MEALIDSLKNEWENLIRLAPRVVFALLVLVLLIWIGRVIGRLFVKFLERGKLTRTHKSFFRHVVTWSFALLGVVIGLNVLGLQAAAAGLMAGGGITAVVLGFAFRGIGENFLAGFFLAFSRPFEIGDVIQSGEFVDPVSVTMPSMLLTLIRLKGTALSKRISSSTALTMPSSVIWDAEAVAVATRIRKTVTGQCRHRSGLHFVFKGSSIRAE